MILSIYRRNQNEKTENDGTGMKRVIETIQLIILQNNANLDSILNNFSFKFEKSFFPFNLIFFFLKINENK
jgi:hypothetical protein